MKSSPFPWLMAGENSSQVTAQGSIAMPAAGTSTILSYTVPQGMIFVLRGVVVSVLDPSATWIEGGAQLLFTLQFVGSGGSRPVQFFANVPTQIGSRFQPYPIVGRCEFLENDTLNWNVVSDGTVTPGSPQFLIAHLMGHTYPALDC